MLAAAAWLYALLACSAAVFQLAVAGGAPWGHLTLGGRYPGRVPGRIRAATFAQAVLLVFLSFVVLGRAGVVSPAPPGWLFWVAVAITTLSTALNLATPSIPERKLWGPVALLMLVSILRVAVG